MQILQNVFPTGTVLKLVGVLNETFDKTAFVRLAGSGHLLVDFDGVTRVTSFGVREWMGALSSLGARYIGYLNARPSVMAQFNTVAQFGSPGELLSFYAPYLCPSCGKDFDSLIDVGRSLDKLRRAETAPLNCPSCGAAAEFDDDAALYFSYAVNAPRPSPPAELRALLSVEGKRLSIDKVVDNSVTGLWLSGELQKSSSFKRQIEGLEGDVVLILDGIQSVIPEGLQWLTSLLNAPGEPIYVARVPMAHLSSLATDPALLGRGILLSVQCEISCPNLHPQHLDIDLARRDSLVQSGQGPSCAVCGQLAPVDGVVSAVRNLALRAAPAALDEFLARRKYPPERLRSSAGKSTPQVTPTGSGTGTPLAPGYFGRYELITRLGIGGMAEVYLARQHGMGGFEKQVVLKRILPNMSADPAFQNMFLREARLAARVAHPNVVQIFDVGHHQDMYFIAMEHVDGCDLSRLLRSAAEKNVVFPPPIAARIASDICAGLFAAHSSVGPTGEPFPIIHRDVSPHNVLVSASGLVKLTDFGIAKAADTSKLTSSDSLKGKVTYMAPELIRKGGGSFDARSDIFPVGIILYQMLTMEHPFRRPTEYGTLVSIIQDEIVDVRKYQPTIPDRVWAVVSRALERNPDVRYQTARAMQAELDLFIAATGEAVTSENIADFCRPLMPPRQTKRTSDVATQTLRDVGSAASGLKPKT